MGQAPRRNTRTGSNGTASYDMAQALYPDDAPANETTHITDSAQEESPDATAHVSNRTRSESYDDYVKIGGSRAWRNNNPGNLEYHGQDGAIGRETAGRFAKFATEEDGMSALKALLGNVYGKWSVRDLITRKYAPAGGTDNNDPAAYVKFLEKHGIDLNKPVGQQVDAMAEAIKQQEGWIPGKIQQRAAAPEN